MLSKRLEAIFNCIDDNEVVADIGTDHAYLPCALIKRGKCGKVYACDIAKGPLNQAKKTIETYGYENNIELILCPGLNKVPQHVTTVVIAGMGAYTIVDILNDDISKLTSYRHIIIQANKNVETVRRWISDHNYTIENELVVFDSGKYYQIIVMNASKSDGYSDDEIEFGTDAIMQNVKVWNAFIQSEIDKCNVILANSTDEKKITLINTKLDKLNRRLKNHIA